jgi:hypothetical protein
MPVVIREIVTEVALTPEPGNTGTAPAGTRDLPDDVVDGIVRRCTERVIEVLRREWDQ